MTSTPTSYEELFERFSHFCETTYPDARADSYLNKLKEEVQELQSDPNMEELADCMLVLVGLSKFLPGNLKQHLTDKIAKNERRTWIKQADGTYRHIE